MHLNFFWKLIGYSSLFLMSVLAAMEPAKDSYTNISGFELENGNRIFIKFKPLQASKLGASWEAEITANQLAHQMGLSPALLSIDPLNRRLTFEVIEDSHSPKWNESNLRELAKKIKLFHQANIALAPFQPSKSMASQLQQIQSPPINWLDQAQKALKAAQEIEQHFGYTCQAPCHLDLWSGNILQTNTGDSTHTPRLWLLDWEYAGIGDPAYDLANFCGVDHLDEGLQKAFLKEYYGVVNEKIWQRNLAYQALALWRWAIWFGLRAEIYNDLASWQNAQEFMNAAQDIYSRVETTFKK